jgi:hypothetical protein
MSSLPVEGGVGNVNQWIHDEFDPRSADAYSSFKEFDAEPYCHSFLSVLIDEDGFCVPTGGSKVCYRLADCRFFDCYKGFMWLEDDQGRVTWRVRVPIMSVPVYPYITHDRAIYIGVWSGERVLTIVDISNGTINDRWPIPAAGDYSMLNPASAYPFFRDGDIVLKSCAPEAPSARSRVVTEYQVQDVIIVETSLKDG